MLHELVELQQLLYSSELIHDSKTLYELKLRVIEENIYGADIDPFAVNVAMLRLWLSLAIEYDGDWPEPLPNLKFKIVRGDSLSAPDPGPGKEADLFRLRVHKDADELSRLKSAYMRKTGEEKNTAERKIAAKRSELQKMLAHAPGPEGAVDWRLEFAEVFDARAGFDVVLANPPYVRADAQFKHVPYERARRAEVENWQGYRTTLATSRIYATLYEKWDYYIPFLERAWQLLRDDGSMVFIISDSYNLAKYATKSHRFFASHSVIDRVDFCSDIPLFNAAIKNTIVHFRKRSPNTSTIAHRVRRWGASPDDFTVNHEDLPPAAQIEDADQIFRIGKRTDFQVQGDVERLGDICYISYGLRANADERYWKGEFVTADVVSDARDRRHPKRFAEGKDLVRWLVKRVRYLEWGTERAPHRFARPTFIELHEASEKLIALVVSTGSPPVAFDDLQVFTTHTACVFVVWHLLRGVRNRSIRKTAKYRDEMSTVERKVRKARDDLETLSRRFSTKYVAAVLNSRFAAHWLAAQARSKNHLYPDDWKAMPIRVATSAEQAVIAGLVDEAIRLSDTKLNGSSRTAAELRIVEEKINARVAQLYGLRADEFSLPIGQETSKTR
jgi:hypothetical protein